MQPVIKSHPEAHFLTKTVFYHKIPTPKITNHLIDYYRAFPFIISIVRKA